MSSQPVARLRQFEAARRDLRALAYRMLGDVHRAEDVVQDAWLRWDGHRGEVEDARAYLVTIVTRLCLNELQSARARREESRPDRLPEPVDLEERGFSGLEQVEQLSMAFLVLLQRLSPAERAVLLLHDVFDLEHERIAAIIGKSTAACRKLLERARVHVARGRRLLSATREEHRRLLEAFMRAVSAGDVAAVVEVLSDDAVMVTDGGPEGREEGGRRNLPRPLRGAAPIANFVVGSARHAPQPLQVEARELNGQPAIVFWDRHGKAFSALLLAVASGKVQRVFFHADASRLRFRRRAAATTTFSGPR